MSNNQINLILSSKEIKVETRALKCNVTREMIADLNSFYPSDVYIKSRRKIKLNKIFNDNQK